MQFESGLNNMDFRKAQVAGSIPVVGFMKFRVGRWYNGITSGFDCLLV